MAFGAVSIGGGSACSGSPQGETECTQIGCGPGIRITLPDVSAGQGAISVRYCLDGQCQEQIFLSADQAPPLLRAQSEGDTVRISVEVRDETGVLARLSERNLVLESTQPNGPQCEPTCYHGEVRVPRA